MQQHAVRTPVARIARAFWSVQRPVVDRARAAVARVQGARSVPSTGPVPSAEVPRGPLGSVPADRVLDFVTTHPLVQPDRTSCGSSSLTVLRMLRDPAYASVVLDADDPERVFEHAALGVRRRTNALRDARGRLQLPWPAVLGVRPAAMVRLLDSPEGFGAPGVRHHNAVIDPADAGPAYDAIVAQVGAGQPVPLYVGDGHWMQHIVLVVRASPDRLHVYDPARGHEVPIDHSDFLAGTMAVAGWWRPWLAILPR